MTEPIKLPPLPLEDALMRAYYYTETGEWRYPETCNEWDRWHAVAKVATLAVEQATADLHAEVEKLRAELARMVRRAGQSKAHRDEVGAELKRLTTLPCSAAHAPPPPPPPLWSKGCPVCGIGCQSGVYGVVCARGDCPTRVTCEVTK